MRRRADAALPPASLDPGDQAAWLIERGASPWEVLDWWALHEGFDVPDPRETEHAAP